MVTTSKFSISAALVAALMAGSASLAAAQADRVAASVDGRAISVAEIEAIRAAHPQAASLPLDDVFDQIVEMAIDAALIDGAIAVENGRKATDVKGRLDDRDAERKRRAWLERLLARDVTESAVRARYDEVAAAAPEDQVEVRQILLDTRLQAASLIERLKAGGDFAELARRYSIGPSARDGGYIGYVSRRDVPAPFADVAFALSPGTVAETPVETGKGWYVVRVEGRRNLPTPTFEAARGDLAAALMERAVRRALDGLRAKADIKTFGRSGTPRS